MELIANEGYWLTQRNPANERERGFWTRLYMAASLTENDFEQWTDAQKTQWEEEHPDEPTLDDIPDSEALDIITGQAS